MEPINVCFQAVQGKDTLLSEQNARFEKLVTDLKMTFNLKTSTDMNGVDVLTEAAIGSLLHSAGGYYCTSDGMREFFVGCGSFALECISMITDNDLSVLFSIWAKLTVGFSGKLEALRVELYLTNFAVYVLPPPVTPSELTNTTMEKFLIILDMHRPRLDVTWNYWEIYNIEEDFRHFLRAFRRVELPLESLQVRSGSKSLQKGWSPISGRFKYLSKFCMGLASAFPRTSTVEAGFSTINREESDDRAALSSLSLQGLMFAKQWQQLRLLDLWRWKW